MVVLFRFNCAFAFLYFGFHDVSCFEYSGSELPFQAPGRVYFGERLEAAFSCVFYNVLRCGHIDLDRILLSSLIFPSSKAVSSVAANQLHKVLETCWEMIVQVRAWCEGYFETPPLGSLQFVA